MAHGGRGGRFPRRSGSSRRPVAWDFGPAQDAAISLGAAGATLWNLSFQYATDALTIVRLRGQFTLMLNSVATIGDGFATFALGMCVVSENAVGVGITAIPHPLTDADWDGWMWHYLGAQLRGSSTTPVGRSPAEAVRVDIDSKAMRKVRDSDHLVGVVEMGTEAGAATAVFSAEVRQLIKLS